jgi:hypothetical protein
MEKWKSGKVEKVFSGGGVGFGVRSAERLRRELSRTVGARTVRISTLAHQPISTSPHQQISTSPPAPSTVQPSGKRPSNRASFEVPRSLPGWGRHTWHGGGFEVLLSNSPA